MPPTRLRLVKNQDILFALNLSIVTDLFLKFQGE